MDEIAAWVRKQAEADLDLAKSAGGGEWHTVCSCEGECGGYPGCGRVEGEDITIYAEGGHDCWQAEHIAAHDPRTEAARAESVLAILDLYDATLAADGSAGPGAPLVIDGRLSALCRAVRLLAFGYRHREGWQEGWKP